MPEKLCPRCGAANHVRRLACLSCGRLFHQPAQPKIATTKGEHKVLGTKEELTVDNPNHLWVILSAIALAIQYAEEGEDINHLVKAYASRYTINDSLINDILEMKVSDLWAKHLKSFKT